MRSRALLLLLSVTCVPPLTAAPPAAHSPPARITILYDAFGGAAGLTQDWGFSALIEYEGRRILF
ncbi:MAG TPA: hypothetical protein VK688_06575, partial [Gemmatimonadales bacterium]|nr:hypothetical protein [Gemmatimonadales bacterium]